MLQDPDTFIPDRFMEGTPESKAVNPDAWVPFGGGVRACVGEKFAMAVSFVAAWPVLTRTMLTGRWMLPAGGMTSAILSITSHYRCSLAQKCLHVQAMQGCTGLRGGRG